MVSGLFQTPTPSGMAPIPKGRLALVAISCIVIKVWEEIDQGSASGWTGGLTQAENDDDPGAQPLGGRLGTSPGLRVWLALDRQGRCWGSTWGWPGVDDRPTQGHRERAGATWLTGNQRGRDYPI